MGFFDLFKKKSEEEEFYKAVSSKDYLTVARLGEQLLQKHPDSTSILTSYAEALIKLGKKKKAISTLLSFAEKKIAEEYYDVAIPILKRILKIDPLNLQAVKLLVQAYRKKELYYEAFKVLVEAYKQFKESNEDTSKLQDLFERFIQEQFHPMFYEGYADILLENGKKEEAFTNYILAGNLYASIKHYKDALRAFLKAREIRKAENIDQQIVEVLSYLPDEKAKAILLKIITDHNNNYEFLKHIVSTFKAQKRLSFLKEVTKSIAIPKTKSFLLALISLEEGEVEDSREHLEKLKLLDPELFEILVRDFAHKLPNLSNLVFSTVSAEELPEPEEVLDVLDKAINIKEFEAPAFSEETISNVNLETKQLEEEGLHYVSMAEAMIGIGNYEEAVKYAKKALGFKKQLIKALSLITAALKHQQKYREALTLLMEYLEKLKDADNVQRAKIKELIAEVYESMGEKERALLWYREAYNDNPDPEIDEKIRALSS